MKANTPRERQHATPVKPTKTIMVNALEHSDFFKFVYHYKNSSPIVTSSQN